MYICVCRYIYIYVCAHAHTHTRTYTSMYIYVYILPSNYKSRYLERVLPTRATVPAVLMTSDDPFGARLLLTCIRISPSNYTSGLECVLRISLYKRLFYFKALLWETIILILPPPHLQSLPYCNSIARPLRNLRPPHTELPIICHTPYTIGDGNIVHRQECVLLTCTTVPAVLMTSKIRSVWRE